jgi:hypothetical protein
VTTEEKTRAAEVPSFEKKQKAHVEDDA